VRRWHALVLVLTAVAIALYTRRVQARWTVLEKARARAEEWRRDVEAQRLRAQTDRQAAALKRELDELQGRLDATQQQHPRLIGDFPTGDGR